MKFSAIIACSFFLASFTEGKHTVRTRQLRGEKQSNNKKVWKRTPADRKFDASTKENNNHRRLLNGGAAFIVSQYTTKESNYVDWCLDAVHGITTPSYMQSYESPYPNLGIRPCAFNSGPTEQLFLPSGDGQLVSRFDYDVCLLVGNGTEPVEDGQPIRLGPCALATTSFIYEEVNQVGLIRVASNPNLCMTSSGTTLEDDDNMIVKTCQPNSDRFNFMLRSGYYVLYDSEGCVAVTNNDLLVAGDAVTVEDCYGAGFGAHWRLDSDGLFHSRLDEGYCMDASGEIAGSSIVVNPCDNTKPTQRFSWPDGYEAPISLQSDPSLYIEGSITGAVGTPVVLGTSDREWSGDAVHI